MAEIVSTGALRRAWQFWLNRCHNAPWSNPTFYGRTIGGVPTPWVDAVKALESALMATGYVAKSRWAYNFRGIGGRPCSYGNPGYCSLHAYGIAIDIDPAENPFIGGGFSWSKTKFTPTQIAAVEAIRNTKGEQMWTWGGRWNTKQDYMHFQARVDPASTHVDWSTVAGKTEEDDVVLKRGDKGKLVGWYQAMLNAAGANPKLVRDEDFGPATEAAVKAEQKQQEVAETGEIDGPLAAFLSSYSKRWASKWGITEDEADAKYAEKEHGPHNEPTPPPDLSGYVQRGDDVTLT